MDSSTELLDRSISYIRGVWLVFLLLSCFVEMSELNTNSVDPDQLPHSAASDLGLYCLPMSLLWDARHKSVKGLGSLSHLFHSFLSPSVWEIATYYCVKQIS